jgi:hypothetical protein
MGYRASRYYRGRYECCFCGRRGTEIKVWIQENFGPEDDMIYASDDSLDGYQAMLSVQQLTATVLKWS